jgi:galactonate dehydratase
MFDLSGGLNNDQLIRFMDVCVELDLIWVEEPLDAFNFRGLSNLAGRRPIPIAAGERSRNKKVMLSGITVEQAERRLKELL